ncbi:uncharacterized protein TrAtP1_010278 [Trichoderma atroviride]|uniref:uncharacterized protein n=1 Tax=Hypocrea atroviridis TaxID=63577 RepID=UPI00331BCD72|nr:hypothetical protein TrAtP1_010278 [Trichoderma atroviride]
MATEATVLHGPLPSTADGSTTSPTPRGGDGKLDDRPLSHTAVSRQRERRERMRDEAEQDKEAYSSDDASVRSSRRRPAPRRSSFPYRDIIKSVLSNIMTKNEEPTSSPPSSRPSSSQGKDKPDMKDKKVEDVVRGLAMEEWNARWLDELVAKVKGELSDAASDHSVSDGRHTPSSQSSDDDDDASLKDMKRYQPTVEDCDSDSDSASEPDSHAAQEEPQPLSRSSSLSSASSNDSAMSSPSSQSSVSTAASSPPPAESESPKDPKDPRLSPRPTVHFSPPTIHFLPPEPTPELERDQAELYRTQSLPSQPRPPIVSERQAPAVAERPTPAWGALFNDRDEPTPALGRLLRGLATYIIAEYSPTDSLVITPDKLFKFYTRYKLDNEFFPFQRVFDTRYHKSIRGLSFLYTDLRCEHHLVQESITRKPVIPALTPAGFEDWMTLLIRAFPDREAKRLDIVLADVPLLADDRHSSRSPVRSSSSERLLPRQLPRQLFPERGHARAFDLLESSFSEWNRITTVPVPPPEVVPAHPLAYSLTSNIPASLQKLPPAASKALMEDTRRHKDACYIDQTRLRPSSIIYPSSASPSSPSSSSFSTSSIPADVKSHSEQQPSSSSSSKHHHRTSRSKERDSRHRTASDRSSRPRERSPTGRRSHRSRRYRGTSPSESVEQRYSSGRSDERRRERERRGSVAER